MSFCGTDPFIAGDSGAQSGCVREIYLEVEPASIVMIWF
jgi:hypothetical protein